MSKREERADGVRMALVWVMILAFCVWFWASMLEVLAR